MLIQRHCHFLAFNFCERESEYSITGLFPVSIPGLTFNAHKNWKLQILWALKVSPVTIFVRFESEPSYNFCKHWKWVQKSWAHFQCTQKLKVRKWQYYTDDTSTAIQKGAGIWRSQDRSIKELSRLDRTNAPKSARNSTFYCIQKFFSIVWLWVTSIWQKYSQMMANFLSFGVIFFHFSTI